MSFFNLFKIKDEKLTDGIIIRFKKGTRLEVAYNLLKQLLELNKGYSYSYDFYEGMSEVWKGWHKKRWETYYARSLLIFMDKRLQVRSTVFKKKDDPTDVINGERVSWRVIKRPKSAKTIDRIFENHQKRYIEKWGEYKYDKFPPKWSKKNNCK